MSQATFESYFDYTYFDAVLPSLLDGREPLEHQVVIVGGGPIGFAMALALAKQGIRSVVLEADNSVCQGSRAGCVTRRTLEIFEQLGVAAPIMRQGLAWSEAWSSYRTDLVFHLQMPQDPDAKYPNFVNIQQCYVEQYLVDELARYPDLVSIRWQTQLTSMSDDGTGVDLTVATPNGDYTLRAAWVVACDGAKSTVRRALGLRFVGTRYEGRYVIVDIKMKSDLPAGRRAWFDPPSNPGSTLLLHKHRDDLWRFDYQLRDDEDADEAVRPENVLQRVQSHLELMGERAAWKPVWISIYSASCLTLERYQHGRVLLAGDAAHLVPIFGVRGMNSGIDDVNNLAWKLAYVCQGLADHALLDSYSDERVHATRENMRHASKSAEFMAPPSVPFAQLRKAVLSLAQKHSWVRSLINPRQSTAVGFPDSPLNVASDEHLFTGGPVAGANLPDVKLGTSYFSSLLGRHFSAVTFVADPITEPSSVPAGDLARYMTESEIPVYILRQGVSSPLARKLDAQPGTTYLIRPDGHLLARWRRFDEVLIHSTITKTCRAGSLA
jgi:3-(3-hydroxy-phenyl)propionate hydroxylase